MAFEQKLILQSLLVPAIVAMAGSILAWKAEVRDAHHRAQLLAALGWWFALVIGQSLILGWKFWSDESWQVLLYPLLVASIVSLGARKPEWSSLRSSSLAILGLGTAWLAIPRSEAWKDLWPEQSSWMVAITASYLLNTLSVEDLLRRDGQRWGLWILVGALGPVVILAATAYGTMAEWVMAAFAATFAVAFIASFSILNGTSSIVAPTTLLLATMIAWTRFRGTSKPVWFYAVLFLAPSLIAWLDRLVYRYVPHVVRILMAASLSISVTAMVAIDAIGSDDEEW